MSAGLLTLAAVVWLGPVQVAFDVRLPGNPHDFHTNDVRVTFTCNDGHREERLAYYDHGIWKAWLATTHAGEYTARLTRNGEAVDVAPARVSIRTDAPLALGGFVRANGTRLVTSAGTPYFPLGHNLGWQAPQTPALPRFLRQMGAAGMNWTRIWACAWDGKNPFFSSGEHPPAPGHLLPCPLQQWDELVETATASGVRLQLVLFHHGLFSTQVNPNWDIHAWNTANGGFLANPADFFTDPTARDYTQRWLRHAVARWGHSPAILAWELFNEVEWVDRVRIDHDWPAVAAWHADMAAFVRALDPYGHLITTSSALEHPPLYAAMDYVQPHVYTRNLEVAIGGSEPLPGKPWFFGEFGGHAHGPADPDEPLIARAGLWASVLAGHAGAAGYWYWDRVAGQGFSHEFTRVARVLERSRLPARTEARPMSMRVGGAKPAPLVIGAGRGWGPGGRTEFRLPEQATPRNLAQLSSFIRGPSPRHPEPVPPLVFHVTTAAPGEIAIVIAAVGAHGAGLEVRLDGKIVSTHTWPARETADPTAPSPEPDSRLITVPCAAGAHTLSLRGLGPDWVQFTTITLPGLGQTSRASAIGTPEFVLARVQTDPATLPARLDLGFEGLRDGSYALDTTDLDTGEETRCPVVVENGTLRNWDVTQRDVVLVLSRD